jgi:hypothetical protein
MMSSKKYFNSVGIFYIQSTNTQLYLLLLEPFIVKIRRGENERNVYSEFIITEPVF